MKVVLAIGQTHKEDKMTRFPELRINIFILCILVFFLILFNITNMVKQTVNNQGLNVIQEIYPPSIKGQTWKKPAKVDWEKILHFIPDKENEDCLQLFTTPTSSGIKNTSVSYTKYQEYMELIKAESERLGNSSHVPAPKHTILTLTYQTMAKEPWVKTVCEVGFDHGQSSLAWLTAKPDLILHSFDIGTRHKTPYMAKLLRENFNDRFIFHIGSSDIIMAVSTHTMKEQCDIISVDGGHKYDFVLTDFIHMRKMAAQKHMIIGDDIEYPGVRQAWTALKELGIVTEQYRYHITGIDIDFVIGQYGEFYWE